MQPSSTLQMHRPDSTPLERWLLYLPRNLSNCSECEEELTKHIQRKTKLLDNYLTLYPKLLPRIDSGIPTTCGDLSGGEYEFCIDEYSNRDSRNSRRRKSDVLPSSSSSLKTCIRSNSNPVSKNRRKAVRFADSLGLELEHTRSVLWSDLPPYIPGVVKKGLDPKKRVKSLAADFALSPTGHGQFDNSRGMVYLNLFNIYDACLMGNVNVRNLCFEKLVFVRYSCDEWKTSTDVPCKWASSNGGGDILYDVFTFCIFVPMDKIETGLKIHFAVYFLCELGEFWDNNAGKNFTVECYERTCSPWDHSWFHGKAKFY